MRKLNDDDLGFLHIRLTQTVAGDRGEVLEFLSKDKNMDKILSSAATADDLFNMLEFVGEGVRREFGHRYSK